MIGSTKHRPGLLGAAAIWSVGDALLHVIVQEVEPLRIAGNALVVATAALVSWLDSRGTATLSLAVGLAAIAEVLTLDVLWVYIQGELPPPALVLMATGLGLLVAAMTGRVRRYRQGSGRAPGQPRNRRSTAVTVAGVLGTGVVCAATAVVVLFHAMTSGLYDGRLVRADYFTTEPRILSAGLGFDGIIGLSDIDEDSVRSAGGGYATTLSCADPDAITDHVRTSASPSDGIDRAFILRDDDTRIENADGLPVVFSWPVRSDTIDPEQFQFTLTNGDVVVPDAAGIVPNWELDERQTVVVFGQLGNRETGRDAVFPERVDIVEANGMELMLAGPDGDRPATGMSLTMDASGYGKGPTLVAAKLTRVPEDLPGEGGVVLLGNAFLPNDEKALYGQDAQYRLRMLTTGGFSPDGVLGLQPDDFKEHFRLLATGADGGPMVLGETDVDYEVQGGTVRVVGLSDLGHESNEGQQYDDCYAEDADNQIDVILTGDEAAVRSITHLEMPGDAEGYSGLYNPGGPGPDPDPGTTYTQPSPPLRIAITDAIDDPMQVTRD